MESFPRCGEIYLVKERPALIVSLDVRNRLAEDVIAIPLSTNLREAPTHVLIKKGIGGLRKDSMAKCEQITTLDKSLLIRGPFAGKIPQEILKEVFRAIMNSLEVSH